VIALEMPIPGLRVSVAVVEISAEFDVSVIDPVGVSAGVGVAVLVFRIDSAVQPVVVAVDADHLLVNYELIRSDRRNGL
jgi:hypothetical protein